MRTVALALLVATALLACSPSTRVATSPPRDNAISLSRPAAVHGRFIAVGGPCCLRNRPMAGTGTVTFRDAATGKTTSVSVDADGTFHSVMPTGTYDVVGTISTYLSGHGQCNARSRVVVRLHGSARSNVYCQER
jgi:hypothetical protein